MNTEEIKMVLETISALGSEGKSAFIWYLLLTHGTAFVLWLLGFPLFLYTVWRIVKQLLRENENERQLKEIRKVIDPQSYGYYSDYDHKKVMDRVKGCFK